MANHRVIGWVLWLSLCVVSSAVFAADKFVPRGAIGLDGEISQGEYGSGSSSTWGALSLIVDWYPTPRFDLELVIPLVYQGATSTSTDTSTSTTLLKNNGYGQYASSTGTVIGATTTENDQIGLGDISLVAGYVVLKEQRYLPQLRPTLYLKFPTGNENKGLSTGAFDWGVGLAVSKWFGDWQPFVEGRYIFPGAPAEGELADYMVLDGGLGWQATSSLLTLAYGRTGTSPVDGLDAPLEARLKVVIDWTQQLSSEAYLIKGFSDGSPDYGGGFSLMVAF